MVSIVFAHTDVAAWEKLLNALRKVGLVVTTSWPMRSEMPNRPLALVKAALGSSVVLTCRRQDADAVGFYDDVVRELEERIGKRLDTFEHMGLVGTDYFASAVGPAFEVFARYASITKLSGEEVTVGELMVLARQVVARRAMRQLVGDESLTALDSTSLFYLTWRWAYLTAESPQTRPTSSSGRSTSTWATSRVTGAWSSAAAARSACSGRTSGATSSCRSHRR